MSLCFKRHSHWCCTFLILYLVDLNCLVLTLEGAQILEGDRFRSKDLSICWTPECTKAASGELRIMQLLNCVKLLYCSDGKIAFFIGLEFQTPQLLSNERQNHIAQFVVTCCYAIFKNDDCD